MSTVILTAVVAAAFLPFLHRALVRADRRRRRLIRVTLVCDTSAFVAAMSKTGRAAADFERAMRQIGEVMETASKRLAAMRAELTEGDRDDHAR